MNEVILLNGQETSFSKVSSESMFRAFAYGDGFFETMRAENGHIPLWDYHIQRINRSAQLLGLQSFPLDFQKLRALILSWSAIQPKGMQRLRLQCWRAGSAGYFSASTQLHWMLQADDFRLNPQPVNAVIFDKQVKPTGSLSALKSCSALLYVQAQRDAQERNADEAVILNQHQRVAETAQYNLFVLLNDQIITPPLSEGPVAGVMRAFLLEQLKGSVSEVPLSQEMLKEAESVVITNALQGVRWVSKIEEQSYSSELFIRLQSKLQLPGFSFRA